MQTIEKTQMHNNVKSWCTDRVLGASPVAKLGNHGYIVG